MQPMQLNLALYYTVLHFIFFSTAFSIMYHVHTSGKLNYGSRLLCDEVTDVQHLKKIVQFLSRLSLPHRAPRWVVLGSIFRGPYSETKVTEHCLQICKYIYELGGVHSAHPSCVSMVGLLCPGHADIVGLIVVLCTPPAIRILG